MAKAYKNLEARMVSMEKSNQKLTSERDSLKKDNMDLTSKCPFAESAHLHCERKLKDALRKVASLTVDNSMLRRDLEIKDDLPLDMANKLSAKIKSMTDFQMELEGVKAKLAASELKLGEKESDLAKAQVENGCLIKVARILLGEYRQWRERACTFMSKFIPSSAFQTIQNALTFQAFENGIAKGSA